jgi:predicted RNA-binding protein with PUA-like domain
VTGHFLLKTEPSEYSFADLLRERQTVWDGVANAAALSHLRSMQPGDSVLIYETGKVKSVVGIARVMSVQLSDPRAPTVKIKADRQLPAAVALAQIKADKLFSTSPLVRQGRLSVVPLSEAQYRHIVGASG